MKILPLFAVGLLVTVATVGAKPTATTASPDQCAKHDEGKTYGLSSDCHKYVTCKGGKLTVKSCSSKKNYDVVTSKCVKIAKATCAAEEPEPVPEEPHPVEPEETDEQYDYLCNNVLYGIKVHPHACDKYISCMKQKAKIDVCQEGHIFSEVRIECVAGNKATCTATDDETNPTDPESGSGSESESSESENESDSDEPSEEETPSDGYDHLCANVVLGNKPHPGSCDKYISCSKQKAKEKSCKDGYGYSSKYHLCVKEKNSDCAASPQEPPATEEPPTTDPEVSEPSSEEVAEPEVPKEPETPSGEHDHICANTHHGKKPHPHSCKKYISCSKHKAKEVNCKKGYGYSSKSHQCVKEKNSDCAASPQEPPATEEPPTTEPEVSEPSSEEVAEPEVPGYDYVCAKTLLGNKPHPDSCNKYISCSKHKAKEVNCKQGYGYSSKLHLCVKQKNSDCPAEPEGPSDGYDYVCVKTLFGNKPHPDSCNKYISCSKHKAKEVNCKKGYGYSSKFHLCVKEKSSDCASSPEEPPATEVTTAKPEPETTEPQPETTKAPATTTRASTTTTAKPEPETTEPQPETTPIPLPTTPLAVSTTTKAPVTTAKPEPETTEPQPETTKAPATTTKAPTTTTAKPETTKAPATTTQASTTTTAEPQPATTQSQPATTKAPATTAKPEPETTEPQPETTKAPATTTQAPTTTTAKPETTKAPATTAKPEPETTEPQPETTKAPATTTQASTTTTAEPQPSTTRSQPTTTRAPTTTETTPPTSGGDPEEPSCEGIVSGYLAIEGNCTQYVYCQQGEPELRDCLENYIFYEPFLACLPGNTATCELFGV
ncbi:proteoglycan 4-like [Anopheles bellator]|uniref:proteoglycan 4-like n=1 Tax=Anopheles bellator TaxID=139047 RepID=UPI002649A2AA|nr:proteoglycan 4-like [Anopheles bellator]